MLDMGRKCRKFKPFKTPRYLPGTVEQIVWKTDLVEYNKHRLRVFNMSSKVDDSPPLMNPHRYINSQRLAGDAIRVREMDKSNKEMIRRINVINRMGGRIDTFNPLTYIRTTQWRKVELFHQEVEKRNKQIYKIIKDAKSLYRNSDMTKFWNECRQTIILNSKFPPYFLKNKTIDQLLIEQPSICDCICMGIHEAERPMCFMDIRVKDGVYLGRMIIELYDDIVPVTVQNFLSLCTGADGLTYKNCSIHKVIAGKWLETGDITKGNGKGCVSIYGDTFDEENFMLRHSKAGVLSTIPVRKCENNSQFSITFDKMEALDGVRVVFGKIVKGNATLFQINDLGRKFGRPIAPIIVCDCGLFVKGKTLTKLSRFKYF